MKTVLISTSLSFVFPFLPPKEYAKIFIGTSLLPGLLILCPKTFSSYPYSKSATYAFLRTTHKGNNSIPGVQSQFSKTSQK